MRLCVHGVTGRMGRAVVRLAAALEGVELVGGFCPSDDPALGRDVGELAGLGTAGVVASDDLAACLLGASVVIDFTLPVALPALLRAAVAARVPVVSGTTGLDESGKAALRAAAEHVPVLWAPNMSLGIQVLSELLEQALRRLGPGYDVEIVELHHRRKVDAPSGTALRLADAARRVRPELREVRGRDGEVGARKADELGIFGVRGGDVIGDHTVYLMGPSERIELTHRAADRDLFAHGALRAAQALIGRAPGLYGIADV